MQLQPCMKVGVANVLVKERVMEVVAAGSGKLILTVVMGQATGLLLDAVMVRGEVGTGHVTDAAALLHLKVASHQILVVEAALQLHRLWSLLRMLFFYSHARGCRA